MSEKSYQNVFDRAKNLIEKGGISKDSIMILEQIFPDLKCSDDEMIRKNLIRMVRNVQNDSTEKGYYDIPFNNYVTWLEKQEEANDFGKLMNKLSAKEQQIMFDAWEYGINDC